MSDVPPLLAGATVALPDDPKPNQVVTMVIHKLGVIDLGWNEGLRKWVLLRVLKSFIS